MDLKQVSMQVLFGAAMWLSPQADLELGLIAGVCPQDIRLSGDDTLN